MASMQENDSVSDENDKQNRMDVDKDSDESTDESDSSNDTSDSDEEDGRKLSALEKKVCQTPYEYSSHVELIKLLRKIGELEKLRIVRERMNKYFPLSPELWQDWLEDEKRVAVSFEERSALIDLFERAVKDYVSVDLWLEYGQFIIGLMGDEDGMDQIREVFERALTAAGLHVPRGVVLWEAYREFEQVFVSFLEMKAKVNEQDKDKFNTQKRRLDSLYRRQLAVPLLEMERTYEEYVNWIGGGCEEEESKVDPNVDRAYKKALGKLSKVLPFEMQLMSTPDSRADVYRQYLAYECSENEPTRVQCLYERALTEICLDPVLWLDYIKYLDHQLKIDNIVIPVCVRAVRNCPWNESIWVYYLRVLERYNRPHETVTEVMEQALAVGFSTATEYRGLWMTYLDYLRRRVKWEDNNGKGGELAELRATFNRACEHLAQYFGLEGDPTCTLLQAWARMEAIHSRDLEAMRRLWTDILSQGHEKTASMWLEYITLEKCYGDTKHLRKLYQRALTATQDWPESIGDSWLNFERDEGTLESFEACESKYEARMKVVREKRSKEEAQLAESTASSHGHDKNKRKRDDVGKWASLGGSWHSVKNVKDHTQSSKEDVSSGNGELQRSDDADEHPVKKKKKEESETGEHGVTVQHDPTKDSRTVFVSNLDYSVTEESIRELFSQVGTITDLRLVKDYKGRSKGYCYLEFSSPAEILEALKKDREPLGNRPMYVSKCDPDKRSRQSSFKYSSELEKNKLFVKGLPLTTTKDELEELFKPYGLLKDVRIVTYRNGHSKGLAYVEFLEEAAAAHALIKTDGIKVGNRVISVAISKPPVRKNIPYIAEVPNVQSLGGGIKEKGIRGRGRTQMFVPRAVQKTVGGAPASSQAGGTSVSVAEPSENSTNTPKSNSDFRKMLLGTK